MRWIDEQELLELTGYKSRGWLRRALDKQGIKYIVGKNGRLIVPASSIERLVAESDQEKIEFI